MTTIRQAAALTRCKYRLEIVGQCDCGCPGNKMGEPVYGCSIHEYCQAREYSQSHTAKLFDGTAIGKPAFCHLCKNFEKL